MIRSEQIAKLKEKLALHEQTEAAYAAWQKDRKITIQVLLLDGNWRDCRLPSFEETDPQAQCHYRIKPTPRLRPWTKDEARGKWIRCKKNPQAEVMLTEFVTDEGVIFAATFGNNTETLDHLLENFTQLDGSPCGVQE